MGRSSRRSRSRSASPRRRDDRDRRGGGRDRSGHNRDHPRDSGRDDDRSRDRGRDSGRDYRRPDRRDDRRDDRRSDYRRDEPRRDDRRGDDRRRGRDDYEESNQPSVPVPSYQEEALPDGGSKVEPKNLEEIIKKKQEADKAQQKPTFLTKKQRQELALKRRQEEVAAQRAALRVPMIPTEALIRRDSRSSGREWDRDRVDPAVTATGPTSEEVARIKSQYLGKKESKKRFQKNSEKFKFNFDWDAGDDTTAQDINPIYREKFEYKPQFGRGFLAGMDPQQQISNYQKALAKQGGVKSKSVAQFELDGLEHKAAKLEKMLKTGSHWSDKPVEKMTERDWRIFREDHDISVKGSEIPPPFRKWSESGLPAEVLKAIEVAGYEKPSAIQMQTLPLAMSGRDVLGVAETGSGKTAAFVLPMLMYILKMPKLDTTNIHDGPYALILAPTRELAQQIEAEAKRFASPLGFRTLAIVGGISIEQQGFALQNGVHCVIATPGRLLDCIHSRYMALNQCYYVVLDEADKMIDMGFEPEIREILDAMPATNLKSKDETEALEQEKAFQDGEKIFRHTQLYSATMPQAVEKLAETYLRRPAVVQIGQIGKAVDRIQQIVTFVRSDADKLNKLMRILEDSEPPIVVFVGRKSTAETLGKQLSRSGWPAARLHSGRSQEQRMEAMQGFREGTYSVLVATDVAARGIDVPGVTHVIQYDCPKTIEDYTHRVGRTGRAGKSGLATLFITPEQTDIMYDLKNFLEKSNQVVPRELKEHAASSQQPGGAPVPQKRRDTVIYAN